MALRTFAAVSTVVMALLVGYGIGAARTRGPSALRDEHSRPTARVPSGMVAVTGNGKTFHDPRCKYIHGKVEMLPASDAVREGYTPCTRCMRAAIGK